jgi:hypothetical protein
MTLQKKHSEDSLIRLLGAGRLTATVKLCLMVQSED